jgi:hypothetical protein
VDQREVEVDLEEVGVEVAMEVGIVVMTEMEMEVDEGVDLMEEVALMVEVEVDVRGKVVDLEEVKLEEVTERMGRWIVGRGGGRW